jgi:hypothetical protein
VRAAARPDHELAGTGPAGGPDQAGSRVAGPDHTQRPAQFAEQLAVLLQLGPRRLVEIVDRRDVHPFEPGTGEPGEISGITDEPFVGG